MEKLDQFPLRVSTLLKVRWADAPETVVRIVPLERPRTWTTEPNALGLTIRTTGTVEPAGGRTR